MILVAKVERAGSRFDGVTLCGSHIIDIHNSSLDGGITIVDMRHEQAAADAL